MADTLTIPFSETDEKHLRAFKKVLQEVEESPEFVLEEASSEDKPLKRHRITMPSLDVSREEALKAVEEGDSMPIGYAVKLPPELIESAKAHFIATGGNISEVAHLFDLTPKAVIKLANENNWPVYGGSTKAIESKSKGQLLTLKDKLWHKLENMLDAMEVETKEKKDLVQHREHSKYVESLSARSTAFKALMDSYMRVSTLLEPELFAGDPDGANWHAGKARNEKYPGGIEGVNREMADFFSEVVMGVADKIKERELKGYGDIIEVEVEAER